MKRVLVEEKLPIVPPTGMSNSRCYHYGEYGVVTSLDELPGETAFHLSVSNKGKPVETAIVEELWKLLGPPGSRYTKLPSLLNYRVVHFIEDKS